MTTTTNGRIPKLVHVTSVEVLHDRVVHLTFTDGCEGDLDLGGLGIGSEEGEKDGEHGETSSDAG